MITILFTPATIAGTAFIINEDGYAAVPPGTYKPTDSIGFHTPPNKTPCLSLKRSFLGICLL